MANSANPDQLAGQLIWIYTVCKGGTYPGSAGPGLIFVVHHQLMQVTDDWLNIDQLLEIFAMFFFFYITWFWI